LAEVSRMGGWFCVKFGSLQNGLDMLGIVYHNTEWVPHTSAKLYYLFILKFKICHVNF
jgi:hypothetical protein